MEKPHFEFKILHITNMPVFVILLLKHKGQIYSFTFIFHIREKPEEFLLTYPPDQFPPNGSIEIEVCEGPDNIKQKDPHIVHLSYNKERSPDDYYVCFYASENHEKALWVAKFWARYNLMYLITGSTSTDEKDVMAFELDEEIQTFEIS
jgi:hypothetical protein